MRRLQLLQITGAHLVGRYCLLPRELIWLCWPECPLKSLPSDFHIGELVILDMQESKVRKLWKGTKILNKLKILNLSNSKCLVKTPNFRGLPSLERMILVDCTSLVEVHQSIGNLKSLVLLNLEGCNSLKSLPESMCSQLEKLPDSLGALESLAKLLAKGTSIKQLRTFGGNNYSPKSCSSSIAMRPASFTSFSSLKELDLSYTGLADAISSIDFGSLSFLEDLNLSGNGFFNLPSSISRLPKLRCFTVERCKNLLSISELPSSVTFLYINDCTSIERVSAPLQHGRISYLSVEGCRNLIEIQGMEFAGNNGYYVYSSDCNNLSENSKMSLIQVVSLSLSLNLHMVVFRTQILITFLETNRDYAKVKSMTFALLVVRYQNGSAIVEKELHYHFICPQFQSRTVINSKRFFLGWSFPLQKNHLFRFVVSVKQW
ncbi:TMV resistance protein [Salix suchowensis]|nr:TMV resistance protein [Salix suchowensis]